jgi:hypothetical protein
MAAAILFLPACSGGDGKTDNDVVEPNERTLAEAVANMRGLSSYHLSTRADPEPGSWVGDEWEIDYSGDGEFRVLVDAESTNWLEYCDGYSALGFPSEKESCLDAVGTFGYRALAESVQHSGTDFARLCSAEPPTTCTPWNFRRGERVLSGPDWLLHPQTPLVALSLVDSPESIFNPYNTKLHLRGTVNPVAARLETARYLYGKAPRDDGYVVCGGGVAVTSEGETIEEETTCRELPPDDSLEKELEHYENSPITVDVWLSSDGRLIEQVVFTECLGPDDCDAKLLSYSQYNEATFDPPVLKESQ